MSTHESEGHEGLLAKLLAGADDPRGMLAASELSDCEECAHGLEDLLALTRRLERLGSFEREALEGARVHGVELPGSRVRRALAHELEPPAAPLVQRPAYVGMRWFAGLAVVLAAFAGFYVIESVGALDGIRLGPRDEGRRPSGEVASYSPFSWPYTLPEGGWFRVVVYDAATHASVYQSDNLHVSQLQLTSEEESVLPDEIRWNVRIYDGSSWIGYVQEAEALARRR